MIEKAIYTLLTADSPPIAPVFALRAPDNQAAPYIIMQRISAERDRDLGEVTNLRETTMQIDVYAEDYYTMRDIALNVESILDYYTGTVLFGVDSPQESVIIDIISQESDNDLLDTTEEPVLYRTTQTYRIWYRG